MGEIFQDISNLAQQIESPLTQKRTWCQKTFGKLQSGSIRGSIFTLTATGLGAGFLAMPKVIQEVGLILGLLMIFFSGLLTYFSLYVISRSCFRYDFYHYGTVTQKVLGHCWGVLLQITVIIFTLGLMIVFNIIIGSLIPSILRSMNLDFGQGTERNSILPLMNLVFVFPLGLQRKLATLRYEALFKLISLGFTLIVVIVEFPYFVPQRNYDDIKYFKFDINIFSAFAIGLFAFICQQNLTRIVSELENKNLKRIYKVNFRSIVLMGIFLSLISIFGYLSLLHDVPDIIITRKAPQRISNDWAMVLARVLISISMTISIAINLIACRFSIEKLVFKVQDKSSLKLHVGITMILIAFTLFVALIYPDVTFMISFFGGLCGSVMVIFIPSFLYSVLSGDCANALNVLAVLIGGVILTIIAIVSVIVDLVVKFK